MNPESQVGVSPNQRNFRYSIRNNIVFGPSCNALNLSLCTALIPHVHIPLLLLLLNLTASESCLFNRRFAYPSREEHEVAKYESAVVISFRYALNFGGWKWTGFGLELHKRSKYLLTRGTLARVSAETFNLCMMKSTRNGGYLGKRYRLKLLINCKIAGARTHDP